MKKLLALATLVLLLAVCGADGDLNIYRYQQKK